MDRDRSRVLALFVVYLALIAAALFAMTWFVAATPLGEMSIDLRSAHICPGAGPCVSFALSEMRGTGWYAPLGGLSFWGTILFSLLVGYQAIKRITSGFASESLSKLGYAGGMILFGTATAAAFLFNPQATAIEEEMMQLEVTRTSAPFLLLLGLVLGIAILYYAVTQQSADDAGEYKPIGALPGRKPTAPPVAQTRAPTEPPVRKHTSSPPAAALNGDKAAAPTTTLPEHLRKKLQFVTLTAELTRAGIDARLEDGSSKLVMWRDVVGIVARRMPAAHDGLTFLDVVSVAGSTLRLLPWTRVTGETLDGEGEAWARALLHAMIARCPEASLDPATKRFQSGEPAAQLPTLAKLAAHDAKLA